MRAIFGQHLCGVADIPGRDLAGAYPRYSGIVLHGLGEIRLSDRVFNRPVSFCEEFLTCVHSDTSSIYDHFHLVPGVSILSDTPWRQEEGHKSSCRIERQ